jgi:hypothetical protein
VDSGTLATGIDATKLADGTITNSELQYINSLSSNAQTQISAAGGGGTRQVAQVGAKGYSVTSLMTYANMPQASVTMTTTGGDVLVQFFAGGHLSQGGRTGWLATKMDSGSDQNGVWVVNSTATGVATHGCGMTQFLFTSVSAASHTFYGRWKLDYAAGSFNNSNFGLTMIVMELA